MRMYDLIMKKRNGGVLTDQEIEYMIQGYVEGEIADYQMSAMLMAISGASPIQVFADWAWIAFQWLDAYRWIW